MIKTSETYFGATQVSDVGWKSLLCIFSFLSGERMKIANSW
jgi:hypothetical protein